MHIRKRGKDAIFGGCFLIILVGYFFQLLPVGDGLPLFKCNTLQFGAINEAFFLNISHRFGSDYTYGNIMGRFIGIVTRETYKRSIQNLSQITV